MRYATLSALCALALGRVLAPPAALASDSASLQFTVPAPDPVQAGETLALQALAVNTGDQAWPAGSYYWVGEIYDLEQKFLARTKEVSPAEDVSSGGVAAISLEFPVPATMIGRKLYRIRLVKDTRTLIESEYKPFQIVDRPLPPPPPPPEVVDYRVEGNITLSYKNSSRRRWKDHNGATAINVVGKIKESSYLFNAHLLHQPGKVVDPFIILLTYYAPWGRVYLGDVSPTLSVLSVNGQGLRGVMLEQQRGRLDWTLLGGQSVASQAGTATANGRFARSLYAAKFGIELGAKVKATLNGFLSADETGSLSSDPKSSNFRGPTLKSQRNSGAGLSLSWKPLAGMTWLADYQKNQFQADTSKAGASDTAWRGELRWEKKLVKFKTFVQRAGPNFLAFGAPTVVGDRMTFDGNLGLFPAKWYTLSLAGSQYTDNLANDPKKLTTTQRAMNMGHAFQFPSGTGLNLSFSLNTARGKPASALDNQTTTIGSNISQAFKKHSVSLSLQTVQFRDKNKLAHDLDTMTAGFNSNFAWPWDWRSAFGVTQSQTKDKNDGSKRASQSVSSSVTVPLGKKWVGQFWGTFSQVKNTSPVFPGDVNTASINSEFTWNRTPKTSLAMGLGYNRAKDKIVSSRSFSEATISLRYSRSF